MQIFPAHRCLHGRVHRSSVALAYPTSRHMDLGIGVFRQEGSGNRHSMEASVLFQIVRPKVVDHLWIVRLKYLGFSLQACLDSHRMGS